MKQLSTTTKLVLTFLLILAVVHHHQTKNIKKSLFDNDKRVVVVEPDKVEPAPAPVIPEPDKENSCDISLKTASEKNKSLIIIFGADWCGYCKSLKKDTASIIDKEKYEICFLNIDNQESKELLEHYKIKIVPTSIMVDPKLNKEVKRIEGYVKNNYLNWLK